MSSRDRTVIGLIVVLVIALGGYLLYVQPTRHQAAQVEAQISTARSQLVQVEAQVQAGLSAETRYRAYAAELRSLSAAVPADQQIPQVINELQAASNRNHVGFQTVSVAASNPAPAAAPASPGTSASGSFPSQSFSLTFTGDYFRVAGLLGTLANFVRADDRHFHASGRLLTINSLSLSPNSGAGTPGTPSGDVTASVTAVDYDIPGALASGTPSTPGAATPAAVPIPVK